MLGKDRLLHAIGYQDKYLTDNPQFSHFKVATQRHTQFCQHLTPVEPTKLHSATLQEAHFNFGDQVHFKINPSGDLLQEVHLEITVVGNQWDDPNVIVPETIFALIQSIELCVGNQTLQKLSGEWLYVHHQLTTTSAQKAFVENMGYASAQNESGTINKNGQDLTVHTLHFSVPFYFQRRPSLALPVIALQHESITVNVQLRPRSTITTSAFSGYIAKVLLLGGFVELSPCEKKSFVSKPLEYIIEQVDADSEIIPKQSTFAKKVELNSHPFVKQVIWAVQSCLLPTDSLSQFFNFNFEFQTNSHLSSHFTRSTITCNGKSYESRQLFPSFYQSVTRWQNSQGINNRCLLRESISTAPNALSSKYCTNAIFSHAFALSPFCIDPSGFVNLDKYNTSHLSVKCVPSSTHTRQLRIFMTRYNIIRIQNGHLEITHS